MDKLFIDLGGHHILGNDLEFLQAACQEPFKAVADTLGVTPLAVSGCVVTFGGGNINWTAGWMWINGELCKVSAGSAAYPANNTWVIVQTPDPIGNQEYEDLNTVDTYLMRRATIQGNAGGTNIHSSVKRFRDYLLLEQNLWISLNLVLAGGSNWAAIDGVGAIAGYRTNRHGEVEMNGEVSVASYASGTDSVICTLPTPPGKDLTFLCSGKLGAAYANIHVKVNTAGDVSPMNLTNGNAYIIRLEQIRYSLDWSGII